MKSVDKYVSLKNDSKVCATVITHNLVKKSKILYYLTIAFPIIAIILGIFTKLVKTARSF